MAAKGIPRAAKGSIVHEQWPGTEVSGFSNLAAHAMHPEKAFAIAYAAEKMMKSVTRQPIPEGIESGGVLALSAKRKGFHERNYPI